MTDKQIIVDGVDVSECIECDIDKIKDGYDALCCLTNCSCKHHPYCYYKKWQRKEQECAKWKHQAELGSETTDRLAKELEEKEKECEELRGELYVTEESLKDYEAHYNRQCEQLNQLKQENKELKEQLTILDDEDVVVEITVEQFEEYKELKAELEQYKNIMPTGIDEETDKFGDILKIIEE